MFGRKRINPWSAQAIIDRVDREKRQAAGRYAPTETTRAAGSRRSSFIRSPIAVPGGSTTGFGGRHGLR